jgi:hypothetical protein
LIEFLTRKTENEKRDDAHVCFPKSLTPDMKNVSDRRKRNFEELFMSSVNNSLVEEGTEISAFTFQHPCTTHILLQVKAGPTTD